MKALKIENDNYLEPKTVIPAVLVDYFFSGWRNSTRRDCLTYPTPRRDSLISCILSLLAEKT